MGNYTPPAGLTVEEHEEGAYLCCECERDVEFTRTLNAANSWTYECLECGQEYNSLVQLDEPEFVNVKTDEEVLKMRDPEPELEERQIMNVRLGRLWWCADNIEEAQQWKCDYMAKGAIAVDLKPEQDRAVVNVILTLDMSTANDVVGYEVQPGEWLAE